MKWGWWRKPPKPPRTARVRIRYLVDYDDGQVVWRGGSWHTWADGSYVGASSTWQGAMLAGWYVVSDADKGLGGRMHFYLDKFRYIGWPNKEETR